MQSACSIIGLYHDPNISFEKECIACGIFTLNFLSCFSFMILKE